METSHCILKIDAEHGASVVAGADISKGTTTPHPNSVRPVTDPDLNYTYLLVTCKKAFY
jgi:hypothetical protein